MKIHYKVISWAAILPPFFSRYKGHDGNLVIDQLVDEAAVRTKKNVSAVWTPVNSDCCNPISRGDVVFLFLFLFFGPWFLDQHPDLPSQLWYFLALHTQSIIVLLHSFSDGYLNGQSSLPFAATWSEKKSSLAAMFFSRFDPITVVTLLNFLLENIRPASRSNRICLIWRTPGAIYM